MLAIYKEDARLVGEFFSLFLTAKTPVSRIPTGLFLELLLACFWNFP